MRTQRQANRSKVNRSSATRRISTTRIPMKGKGVNHLKRDPRTPSQRERVYPLTRTTQATTAHLRVRVTSITRSGTTDPRIWRHGPQGKFTKTQGFSRSKGEVLPKRRGHLLSPESPSDSRTLNNENSDTSKLYHHPAEN